MTKVETIEAPVRWTPDHPRVRELWRTCTNAYVTIAEAIEEAGRLGIPVEIIASAACVPVGEAKAILKEAQDEEV